LGLIAVDTVLALALIDQLWFRDLPCPLCILQRGAFFAAGCGLALNLVFGPRPSQYGVTILSAAAGTAISLRQMLIHIAPSSPGYGNAIFGLHLYTWAFIAFALMIVGCAVLLLDDRQFARSDPWSTRLSVLPLTAFALLFVLAVGNVISTVLICGAGLCPEVPAGYLIFNDNLRLTDLAQSP
jgi:disulfide bond formation protein DsbB